MYIFVLLHLSTVSPVPSPSPLLSPCQHSPTGPPLSSRGHSPSHPVHQPSSQSRGLTSGLTALTWSMPCQSCSQCQSSSSHDYRSRGNSCRSPQSSARPASRAGWGRSPSRTLPDSHSQTTGYPDWWWTLSGWTGSSGLEYTRQLGGNVWSNSYLYLLVRYKYHCKNGTNFKIFVTGVICDIL